MTDCIFCKIAKGEIGSKKIFENELVFAFEDLNPQAPTHMLFIPKEHFKDTIEIAEKNPQVIGEIFGAIAKIVKSKNMADSGFRIVINQGPDAGQAVAHVHFHVLGQRKMHWPPG